MLWPKFSSSDFNCYGSPYGFDCWGSHGSPKQWPNIGPRFAQLPCRWKSLSEAFLGIIYAINMHNIFLYCGQREYFRYFPVVCWSRICQVMLSMACSYRVEGIVICTCHRMAQGPRQKGVRASVRRALWFDTLRYSSTVASGQHRINWERELPNIFPYNFGVPEYFK